VVYECVAGRRPYNPRSLAELIAQTTVAPPKLDDQHGELIASMLSGDPMQRPTFDEIASVLEAMPTLVAPVIVRSPRRWILTAFAALALGGLGVWLLTRSHAPTKVDFVVKKISLSMQGFHGAPIPSPDAMSTWLTDALKQMQSEKIVVRTNSTATATRTIELDIAVTQEGNELVARWRVDGAELTARVDAPGFEPLTDKIATVSAVAVDPRATRTTNTTDRRPDRPDDKELKLGRTALDAAHFVVARGHLERAVVVDPSSFDAWYAYLFVLLWDSDALIQDAIVNTRKAAKTAVERDLIDGIEAWHSGNYADAILKLEPYDVDATVPRLRREILYFLGEANWHDGRLTKGSSTSPARST